MAAGRIT